MKLRTRFALLALALTLASLAGALFIDLHFEKQRLMEADRDYHVSSLTGLVQVAADSQVEFNEVFLLNYFKGVFADPGEFAYAVVLDNDGKVRMHTDVVRSKTAGLRGSPGPLGKPWNGPRWTGVGADSAVLDLVVEGRRVQDWSAPVVFGGRMVGEAHIGFDWAAHQARSEAAMAENRARLFWVGLGAVLLALAGAVWLARILGRQLGELHEGARLLGTGDLRHRVRATRTDEFGDLARAFNAMASELERLAEFKERTTASITHDLRAPLNVIKGHAEMLLSGAGGTPAEQKESAQVIFDNARRLASMADDMTDLAKLRLGRLSLEKRKVSPAGAVTSAVASMKVVADRLQVRLEAAAQASLPGVMADPGHLNRIIVNLIQNSLKFTPEGGRVRVSARAEAHHLRFSVSDSGIGMPAEKLKALFSLDPGPGTGPESGRGPAPSPRAPGRPLTAGLGLVICKELVEAHKGRIRASSEPGRGTEISFTIPLKDTPCSDAC
ncbi:MAG: HAMP domain-containing sensor histidine kinase [Elusimicrobiota bacterium]|jgi:signal transduction histidine kinase